MNDTIVTNILNVIKKSNDKCVVVKALVKLRTDIVIDRKGIVLFRNASGIPPMIRLLNRPNEKILEIVLSILANCCTDPESCAQAFESKIIPPLITILKSVPNPLIQCRACRLLGNLAKENKSQLINYSAATSQSLCLILEETTDLQTTIMSTRAAKFLLNDEQFLKSFIKFDGYKILIRILVKIMKYNENPTPIEVPTKPVGLKLNQHREKYFEEVARHLEGVRSDIFDSEILKNEKKVTLFSMPEDKISLDVIHEILKCIQIISEYQPQGSVMEFYCMEPGLLCIVFFVEANNPFRTIALKIIGNFSKNPFSGSALAVADAVVAACKLLTTSESLKTPLNESEKKYCINIVCMLSTDACNRAKIRRSGALKKLIEIARNSNSYTEISVILYALINFQYDNISMDLMLREGLVGILIKELNAYLIGDDEQRKKKCEEKQRTSRKRKNECEIIEPVNKTPKFWDIFEEESPVGSPNNMSPSSPSSSRSFSPISNCSKNIENDFDSETYSPVCSENDDDSDEDEKPAEPEDFDVMKLLDIAFKNDANLEDNLLEKEDDEEMSQDTTSLKIPGRNTERNSIDIIDKLLFKVTVLVGNRGELGKPQTLSTLIRAINIFGMNSTTFGSSLTNILSESQFFAIILKQNVIHQLYKMTRIEELKFGGLNFIDTLTCVAESGYGRGEVTKLLNIESFVQKRTAIAVAFIIKQPRLLYQLLTENGALYILLNTILNKDDEYRIEAADGITSLAQTLKITIPNCDEKLTSIQEFDESVDFPTIISNSDDEKNSNGNNDMKFLLHRGCSQIPIKFNKKILIENSEVFNSMLNSDFREKNEGLVHLKDYSVNGIKYFLNLINLKSLKKIPNIPPIYYFDSILEAYELSKMYIIIELEKLLFNMLIYRLNSKTCLKVFEWSLKNANHELSEIAINYYLCSELDGIEKVEFFREADYSQYSKEWNQMMTDAILVKCQNLCYDIK